MKAAKSTSVPQTGPRVRAGERPGLQPRIKSNLGRSRRYVEMLLWIFFWTVRESPSLVIRALIADVIGRASVMAAFIGLVKSVSAVARPEVRKQLLNHLAHYDISMRPGVLVLLIAGAVTTTLIVSGICSSLKRRWYEELGARVSSIAHKRMVSRFQGELQGLPLAERRAGYVRYTRFEDAIITALKTGATNSVELFAVLLLLGATIIYLGLLDVRVLIFMLLVVAAFGVFSVGFSYREHLTTSRERVARQVELNSKVNELLDDFIHEDSAKHEPARESFHRLKVEALIEAHRQASRKKQDQLTRLLGFLSSPLNAQIVVSTPVFIFIIFYAYYESYAQEVDLVAIVSILFIARFMLMFSQNLAGEARKFSIKYRQIRTYYMIDVLGRRILPLVAEANARPELKGDEEEDDALP